MDTTQWVTAVDDHWAERFALRSSPRSLTVLFDPECALCQQCRSWMSTQATLVELRFVPCTGEEARARYGDIPWLGDELVVVGDEREVWVGPAAFLVCLWALEGWREWSYRLSGAAFAPLAERFFLFISARRKRLAALFAHDCADGVCRR
ncbi:MAG TPA: DCC1-like thiol-disulfide oxidoreductase family protein [Polyangiaceae bacterium]|nr:DCC1-like thiol-disulfide oxidoreductase family protein [Polyangiaceae bacterium]